MSEQSKERVDWWKYIRTQCRVCGKYKSWRDMGNLFKPDPHWGGRTYDAICRDCYYAKDCNRCKLCPNNKKNKDVVLSEPKKLVLTRDWEKMSKEDQANHMCVKVYQTLTKEEKIPYHGDCSDKEHICDCYYNKKGDKFQSTSPDRLKVEENENKRTIDWSFYVDSWMGKCHICKGEHKEKYCVTETHYHFDDREAKKYNLHCVRIGTHYICLDCAMRIRDDDPHFESFRRKLYCCSKNWRIEYRKANGTPFKSNRILNATKRVLACIDVVKRRRR